MKRFIPATIFTIALAVSPAAFAQEPAQIEVTYAAQDLASPKGVQNLLENIEAKAEKACDSGTSRKTLILQRMENECVSDLVETAVKNIAAPSLAAAYKSQVNAG